MRNGWSRGATGGEGSFNAILTSITSGQVFVYYTIKIQYLGSFPEFSYNFIILLYSCNKLKLGLGDADGDAVLIYHGHSYFI